MVVAYQWMQNDERVLRNYISIISVYENLRNNREKPRKRFSCSEKKMTNSIDFMILGMNIWCGISFRTIDRDCEKWRPILTIFFRFYIIINAFCCLLLRIFLKYRIYVCDQMQNPIDSSNICYIFQIEMKFSSILGPTSNFWSLVATNFFLVK